VSTDYAQHQGHGGFADGVLGLTTDTGQITLVNGWNFYFDSDAAQTDPGPYDIEKLVMHELGHASDRARARTAIRSQRAGGSR
jgi:hypothetical protein